MTDLHRYGVLGRLGASPSGPLLAEGLAEDGAVVTRVVLESPVRADWDRAACRSGCVHLVGSLGRVRSPLGVFDVLPYVPGADLVALREAAGAPLSDTLAASLLEQVAAGLQAAAALGASHGGLEAGRIRVGPAGVVRILPPRRPTGPDLDELRDLFEMLVGLHDGADVTDPVHELVQRWPSDLAGVRDALRSLSSAQAPGPVDLLVPLLAATETALHADPAAGTEIPVAASSPARPAMPPKARLAAVAAVTLALGVATGWTLTAASPSSEGRVAVPGASEIRVDCDPAEHAGATVSLAMPRACRVTAAFSDGSTASGDLDGSLTGRYQCEAHEGVLRCTER